MTTARRIYLDNAATSWPKPPAVGEAMLRALELGVSYGRGQSAAGDEVRRTVDLLRRQLATLCGLKDPHRVVFTCGGTDGLSMVLRGLLKTGDRVVTSALEHNSVIRPLRHVAGVEVAAIELGAEGRSDLEHADTLLSQPTSLVVLTHASNVTGVEQDVAPIASLAHAAGAVVALDVCQTAGHVAFDVESTGADILIGSGHKGLRGPLGTGFVAFREGLERLPTPLRFGGTGSRSESSRQPETLPDRYEAGSMNVPGLFGLAAAIADFSPDAYSDLTTQLIAGLSEVRGLRVVGPPEGVPRVPVVSIVAEDWDPHDLAAILEAEAGVETRAGLHCSPHAHQMLGTLEGGGTLRFSPGACTTSGDLETVLDALRRVLG